MAWDQNTATDVEDLFALLSVPVLGPGLCRVTGGAPPSSEDVIARTRQRDAAYHKARIASDPEFRARRRAQWRASKARAAASRPGSGSQRTGTDSPLPGDSGPRGG